MSWWIWAIVAALLGSALYLAARQRRQERSRAIAALFSDIAPLIEDGQFEARGPADYPRLVGRHIGLPLQLTPVVDTLAVRRLPALWMQVTLQSPLPVAATFDMMMRPAGPTSFSNFDLLPETVRIPAGFPEHAVLRSNDPAGMIDPIIIRPYLSLFENRRAKELLITPHGVRIVWLVAEADRARYGVFRQADFGDAVMRADDLTAIVEALQNIRAEIIAHG